MVKMFRLHFLQTSLIGLFLVLLVSPACGPNVPEGQCRKNSDCQDKTTGCDPQTKTCTPIQCTQDADCRGGWFCNTSQKKCQSERPKECQTNSDCADGKSCVNAKCIIKQECTQDGECKAYQTCDNGKCVARSCKDSLDCGDNTQYECKEGTCTKRTIECSKNEDCKDASKPICKDGTCTEKSGCAQDSDCTDPQKSLCLAGKCVMDTRAGEGKTCESSKTECKTGLFCHRADPKKTTGTCRTSCLPLSPTCPSGQVCRSLGGTQGICLDKNNGKREGEECDKQTNLCERNLYCTSWKSKKVCAALCNPNSSTCDSQSECYEVIKSRFVCVSKRDPCGPGRPCPTGYNCSSGLCNPPPSCEGIQCKDEQVCENGICRAKRCPKEIQCSGGKQCNKTTGQCFTPTGDPPCKPCAAQNPRCPNSTDQCLTGLGNPNEAFCFSDCSSTGTCADNTHFECQSIGITRNGVTCTQDSQCGGGGFKCNNGKCELNAKLCIPKIGTCRNKCQGVTCTGGQICAPTTGTCITTGKKLCDPCTVNDECGGKDDLCVNYGGGNTRCGQDCRSASCPAGYRCYNIGNGARKQCAPVNLQCTP